MVLVKKIHSDTHMGTVMDTDTIINIHIIMDMVMDILLMKKNHNLGIYTYIPSISFVLYL